jgi:cobalt-precorrin 5A hydrolase
MARGEAMMVAGIGCRSGATSDAVAAAIAAALDRCNLSRTQIDALATAIDKSAEPGIAGAARSLGLRLIFVSPAEMRATTGGTLTSSARVESLKGVPSVAETAALAAAGRGARLLAPRIATATVTCAIAVGGAP